MTGEDAKPAEKAIEDLETIFLERYGTVLGCARRFAQSPEQAEDIVQQVFVEFVSHRDRWDRSKDPAPLLAGLTRNIALRYMRDAYRNSPTRIRQIAEHFLSKAETRFSVEGAVDEEPFFRDQVDALNECIGLLQPTAKELIDLHYWQQTPLKAMGELLNVNSKNLGKVLYRIRASLKKCIDLKLKQQEHATSFFRESDDE